MAVHRVGPIAIGESALTVMAAAAHRGRAFDACELVADRVKARVPIWKEQELLDGSIEWVGGTLRPLSLLNILISLYKPVRGFLSAGLFS